MKKRMMAMLMTAILVIASIPFTAFAEEMPAEVLGGEAMEAVAAEAAEAEAVPAAAGEEVEAAEPAEPAADAELLGADPVTVKNYQELKDAAGKAAEGVETTIVLEEDINDMTAPLIIAAGRIIVLDLNGKNLNRGLADSQADSNGSVIAMNSGASLTLRDSLGGGTVTGGNSIGGGGGIYVGPDAAFTMEGGSIFGNKTKIYGGGVYVVNGTESKVVLKGGMIYGNESYTTDKDSGAGIHFAGNGRLFVGGDASVGNNVRIKDGEKITSNVRLMNKLTIGTGENGAPKPTETMSIGITFASLSEGQKVRFTENASSGDEKYFVPDNKAHKVAYNSEDGGYLELQYPTLSIKSDKSTYNVGEQIRLTFETKFVEKGKKIVVTEGPKNTWKVPVKDDGTAAITVNAVTAGSFNYKASVEDTELSANVWVTVTGAPKTYHTVKFNTFGGTPVPETQAVLENGKAARPQKDPAKDGYEFAGWYADAGCTNPYNFNMPIDRDITIFAKWTKKPDPAPSSDDSSEPLFTGNWGNPVKNGAWKQDANGLWSYTTTEVFRNTWGYIANPFAKEGQHQADWFFFDQYGHMLTGWQWIMWKGELKCFYLNPTKDGTLGACLLGPGKTPDGWEVDASGAWTGR